MPRLFACVTLAAAAATPLAAQQSRSYTLAGADVAIYDLVGTVTIAGGTGSAVSVEVTTAGADASRLTVENSEVRGRPTLRVIYPEDRIVYPVLGRGSNTSLTIREDGTWGGSDQGWHDRSEGRRITIQGEGKGLEAAADLRITVPTGKRLAVYVGVGRVQVTNVDGELRVDAAAAEVTSRSTRGRLAIETGAGDVAVDDASGSISLETGSGDVRINRIRDGDLKLETGSGAVEGSGITVGTADIETGSGDIRIDAVASPRLSLETGSGSVNATLTAGPEMLHAETGSGDITVRLPDNTSASVDLDTGSGDFQVEFPLQLIRKGNGNLRGTVGDGRGRIEIETGSGDIALLK